MARPRLGDTESKRLQMVITEEELRAIEDWQFNNRVQSKSEAIRRLCQMGLLLDEYIHTIAEQAMGFNESYLTKLDEIYEILNNNGEDRREKIKEYLKKSILLHVDTVDGFNKIMQLLNLVMTPLIALNSNPDFNQAKFDYLSAKAEALANLWEQRQKDDDLRSHVNDFKHEEEK